MPGGKALRSRFGIGVVIGAVIAFGLAAMTSKAFFVGKQSANTSPFLTEGFDFSPLRSADNVWRGPDIGEKIDLTRLRTKNGETLASVIGKRPIVLVSVNPDCGMCKAAKDEMSYLREKLSSMDINYYIVFFASETPRLDFFRYGDSLKVGAPSFLWNADSGPPPESVFKIVNPSHLLLNVDGTVIRVWPGSNNDKGVRDRMAHQIMAETLVALDTLQAILPRTKPNH
jgi:hypothetical protein